MSKNQSVGVTSVNYILTIALIATRVSYLLRLLPLVCSAASKFGATADFLPISF
jgi:hypothetical protein